MSPSHLSLRVAVTILGLLAALAPARGAATSPAPLPTPIDRSAVERQLATKGTAAPLPLDFARRAAKRLQLVPHEDLEAPMAFFVPPAAGTPGRIALRGSMYLRDGGLRPLADLSVDLAEPYLQALLEAYLSQQLEPGGELGAGLRRRAEETMPEVPAAHRVDAYVDALASFGGHLLSVVNEIDRVEVRRKKDGRSLCAVIDRPVPLFQLWQNVLGDTEYTGAYVESPGGGAEEQVRFSRSHLSADDKRFLVGTVLGASWTGSVQHDLRPRYCPAS